MFQNNTLLKQLKQSFEITKNRFEGVVKGTKKGFGFLDVDSKKSYFIPPIYMKKVMHGDRIIAIIEKENERVIAKPIQLVEPFLKYFVGKIFKQHTKTYIIPEHPLLNQLIVCNTSIFKERLFKNNDWVIAHLVKHKLNGNLFFYANIVEFIIDDKDSFKPWLIILSKYNISKKCIDTDIKKYKNIDNNVRKDLSSINFITIDNCNTKDIDDAIFIKKNRLNQFVIYIAISDPTAYIPYLSDMDSIALKRGFTNYLPGFNIPMLPRELSEDTYSLKEKKRRAVLICKTIVDQNGFIVQKSIKFFLAWIISKSQLSYKQVAQWINKKNILWQPKNQFIEEQINLLLDFCKIRMLWRKYNCISFKDKIEYQFHFSKDNEITYISSEYRNIAHHMVEEAMVLANHAAGIYLKQKINFGIFNTHNGFEKNHIEQLNKFLSQNYIPFTINRNSTLEDFCTIMKYIYSLSNEYIEYRMRKFQSFGELSLQAKPHFALGLNIYATWTSPIRKYTDMINHRLIKSTLVKNNQYCIFLSKNIISSILEIKKRNRIAEKEIQEWLYFIYIYKNNYINKDYIAEIIDVNSSGIRVKLLSIGVIVFVPSCFLHNIKKNIICKREEGIIYINNKPMYRVTDKIKVKIIEINKSNRNIIATLCN
ncbi:Exoribonuclease 2 [Buchnera aphidicola (Thelaxes suberi)]|uniref:exoribonuclease II n=1 Tax=Buchnera aphidicola TaxID=9 RepID=UPI0034648115